jgi:hypothetical protein
MQYKEIKVKFEKPDIWRRSQRDTVQKQGRTYMDCAKEIIDFETMKEEAKKEITEIYSKNIDASTDKNELNMRLSDVSEFYSKAMIPCDDIDENFLLRKTNQNTLAKKLQPWCKNLAYNISTVIKSPPYANLVGKFKDVPAFVCLAGPSLRNNREQLKAIKGKALIIAVDTSLRPLLDIGVVPDICVTHDANPNGCKFFLSKEHQLNATNAQLNDLPDEQIGMLYAQLLQDKERLDFKYDTVGLFVNYCHPLTLLAWNGSAKAFYGVLDPSLPVYDNMAGCVNWKEKDGKYEMEDKGRVVGGSSVGHVAAYIAVGLGCNPISFLGLDLSYPGGLTYVDGASNQKDMKKQKLIELEDLSGNKVPTNVSMLSYKKVFERSLPHIIMETGIKFYNCTEDKDGKPAGILEVGAEPKQLKWVIENRCSKQQTIDVLATLKGGEK